MPKKKKLKRAGLASEDSLRLFITAQVNEIEKGMPSAEKAQLVDAVVALFGPALIGTARAAVLVLTSEEEDDEEEEEEEDDETDYDDDEEDEDDEDDE